MYMSVILHVEPKQVPMQKEEFCRTKPRNSVALDGYVYGGPWFEHNGPYCSFNHHEEVNRLATRATCGQALMAIRQGFFSTFIPSGKHQLHKILVLTFLYGEVVFLVLLNITKQIQRIYYYLINCLHQLVSLQLLVT